MCGIVGYMTEEERKGSYDRRKFLRQAIIMDTLRGKDSTGLYYTHLDGEVGDSPGWVKRVGDGYSFVEGKGFKDVEDYSFRYAVGHNRAATIGRVTTDNAHPFQEGPITLVHNGSLHNTASLPKSMYELKVEVDSHAVCHNLALVGVDEASEVISKINGAFTLVWHDSRDDSLNIVRNDERPLHMAEIRNEKTILFMSEAEMLHAITKRLRINIKDIVYPKPGQFLKFNRDDILNPESVKVDLFRRRYYPGYGNYHGAGDDDTWYSQRAARAQNRRPTNPRDENRIVLGGKRRPIPKLAQDLLSGLDLKPESRLTFMPCSYSPTGDRRHGIVSGIDVTDGTTLMLYGVSEELYERAENRNWTVRPIVPNHLTESTTAVVCELVSTTAMRRYSTGKDSHQLSEESLQEEEEKITDGEFEYTEIAGWWYYRALDADDADRWRPCDLGGEEGPECEMVKGPHGNEIPVPEFNGLVAGGCISCGRPIGVADADDVVWANNSRDPMCPVCVDTWDQTWV